MRISDFGFLEHRVHRLNGFYTDLFEFWNTDYRRFDVGRGEILVVAHNN